MIVGRAFYFGCFMLDPARLLLLRNGEPVTLTPKSFDTLCPSSSTASALTPSLS